MKPSAVSCQYGDLKKDGLIKLLQDSGVKLPADYRLFGRSWTDWITILVGVKKHFPADYDKILDNVPLRNWNC